MKELNVTGATGKSKLLVGESLANAGKYLPDSKIIVITDTIVENLYGALFPPCEVICIGTGEKIKTLDTVKYIYDKLVEMEADRTTFVLGIGGGIVCDIAGFAASTYMRGIPFGFVSTTLLSQVDASVGGKNGVNFGGFKNMVGVFNQPEFVICDLALLKTLPREEILCGFSEIIKHAAISDPDMFEFLGRHPEKAMALDNDVIEKLVYDSVVIKANVVNRDEKEKGERKKLNFGHTFGHALEKLTEIPHGMAVGIGMAMASDLSVAMERLDGKSARQIKELIMNYGLPTKTDAQMNDILKAMKKDKKKEGKHIHFILLDKIGHAVVEEISFNRLESLFSI